MSSDLPRPADAPDTIAGFPPMPSGRFASFPQYLAQRTKRVTLGPAPAIIAHADWTTPAPVMLWLHGRTASKELDPGRYMRWLRSGAESGGSGIAAVAIDLPGHGERASPGSDDPARTLDIIEQALGEIDLILASLHDTVTRERWPLDLSRVGIGGMSLGGMIVLRRLCDSHAFRAAAVEGTAGWLGGMYFPADYGLASRPWPIDHPRERVARLDAAEHMARFRPIPLLDLHSQADEVVPFEPQRQFIERLRQHYRKLGAEPSLIELTSWASTGAAREHLGFGRFGNDAKNIQAQFLSRALG